MTKFQKIQKIASVVPFVSTLFIIIFTATELICKKASRKIWGLFVLTIVASGIVAWVVNAYVMTGEHIILNVIASAALLALTNFALVELQKKGDQDDCTQHKTFRKRAIIYGIVAGVGVNILFIVVLTIATINYINSLHIDDINGADNTNLAVIRQEEVISSKRETAMSNVWTQYNGNETNVTGIMSEYDYQECTLQCKKLSGVTVVQATKTNKDRVVLEISSELVRGNMEIFIILDGQIYDCIPANQACSITVPNTAGKMLVVKVAAESAEMEIFVKRSFEGKADGSDTE